jgi:hypothetical protein
MSCQQPLPDLDLTSTDAPYVSSPAAFGSALPIMAVNAPLLSNLLTNVHRFVQNCVEPSQQARKLWAFGQFSVGHCARTLGLALAWGAPCA